MFLGKLPMLTKGPFALFYGGDKLVSQLSEDPPGRGMFFLILFSAVFQVLLFVLIYQKARNLKMYSQTLKKTLVENVLNIYGIIVIIIISIVSTVYVALHHISIETNKKREKAKKNVPKEIILLFIFVAFVIIMPFSRSFALRYSGTEI